MAVWSVLKLGTELLEYMEPVLDSLGTVLGGCVIIYTINYGFWCFWAKNGHGFWFHKVEPMLGESAAHGQPTARLGTIKNSPDFLSWIEIGPCVFQAKYCLK